jgi:hypothetical protein
MTTTLTDRLNGTVASLAIKAPCQAVSSANLTLAGEQTVNGVAVTEGDRVLVKDQSDLTDNGVYVVSTGDWQRAADFDGARDVVQGTLVLVFNSIAQGVIYQVTTADPIVIGTSSLTFDLDDDPAITFPQSQGEIDGGVVPFDTGLRDGEIERYQLNTTPGTTPLQTGFQRAINSRSAKTPEVLVARQIGVGATLIFPSAAQQGIAVRGNSRSVSIIQPTAADISVAFRDVNGFPAVSGTAAEDVNTLFFNRTNNGHLEFDRVRFIDQAAYTGHVLYCKEGGGADGSGQALFSAIFNKCWFSLSSNNTGSLKGGFANLVLDTCVDEASKAGVVILEGTANNDIVIRNHVSNFSYGSVLLQTDDDFYAVWVRVEGLHAYQRQFGRLVQLYKARTVALTDITLDCDPANLGDLGVFNLKNVIDLTVRDCKATLSNTGGRCDVFGEINGCRGKISGCSATADTGLRITSTAVNISAATSADPIVFTTSAIHKLSPTQQVSFASLPGDFATPLNGKSFEVTVIDSTHFSIDVNGSAFGAYSSGGTVQADFVIEMDRCGYSGCDNSLEIAAGLPSGELSSNLCKWNNSQQYGVLCTVAGSWDWYSSEDEFLNAGMDGVATARNLSLDSAGDLYFFRPRIGRTTNNAAADYFINAEGTGTVVLYEPEFVGTPPVGLIEGSQEVTIIHRRGYGGVIASAAGLVLPMMGDQFDVSGVTNITSMSAANNKNRIFTLTFQGVLTVTDGSNIRLNANANFVTTAGDTLTMRCDGTDFIEISRSVN